MKKIWVKFGDEFLASLFTCGGNRRKENAHNDVYIYIYFFFAEKKVIYYY